LAFDIDYRYMSAAEQNFLMMELARLKDQGRIEVIRERNANYHVFAFIDGKRPGDDLIAASLDDAQVAAKESNHATKQPERVESKSPAAKGTRVRAKPQTSKSRVKKTNSKARASKRR